MNLSYPCRTITHLRTLSTLIQSKNSSFVTSYKRAFFIWKPVMICKNLIMVDPAWCVSWRLYYACVNWCVLKLSMALMRWPQFVHIGIYTLFAPLASPLVEQMLYICQKMLKDRMFIHKKVQDFILRNYFVIFWGMVLRTAGDYSPELPNFRCTHLNGWRVGFLRVLWHATL